ncbi:natural resistance-associated macrophage protein-domain-containing protein [Mycena albidolilacea]|uniref:Natural resistance-associated macrophage protein-domain-containing protein n=1 Tax=Mycena albidolilacea TaxID=1033008 RepID=A0AAD6ZBA3_9AGAR|nr:natural resistance-associated macrophage protein-domain-containing protein [Mycena albidolilacea]
MPPMPSDSQSDASRQTLPARLRSIGSIVGLHVKKHAGVGMVCAVAYFDPGNWGVDLQAGSQFGFRLLFVVLLAGLFAAFLQVLATRLGCVTGLGLASHCRVLLYDRPKHPLLYRWLGLYPLYILSEIAIISTDLAELLGSAIALCLLFPRLEIWQGVLITAFDVIVLLALRDPLRSTPVKMFEILVGVLVLAVLTCMVMVIAKVNVDWPRAFEGFLPSKYIFNGDGLYTSVGILGATVMPHSLFLGSALATQDRLAIEVPPMVVKLEPPSDAFDKETTSKTLTRLNRLIEFFVSLFRTPPPSQSSTQVKRHSDRENNSLAFIQAHLNHGIVDIVGSLLGFAVLINSLILMLAGVVFFYNNDGPKIDSASLFDAYDLIHDRVGASAATLFALALLASGQSSSIIATVAGQAVSEGFLNWRVSPVVRRLLTRLIAVVPSLAVAVAVGRPGIDALLIASQVILAIVLPFITLPLIYLTSSKTYMRVRRPQAAVSAAVEEDSYDNMVDYSSGMAATILGCAIWLIMLTANAYVIVTMIIEVRR